MADDGGGWSGWGWLAGAAAAACLGAVFVHLGLDKADKVAGPVAAVLGLLALVAAVLALRGGAGGESGTHVDLRWSRGVMLGAGTQYNVDLHAGPAAGRTGERDDDPPPDEGGAGPLREAGHDH